MSDLDSQGVMPIDRFIMRTAGFIREQAETKAGPNDAVQIPTLIEAAWQIVDQYYPLDPEDADAWTRWLLRLQYMRHSKYAELVSESLSDPVQTPFQYLQASVRALIVLEICSAIETKPRYKLLRQILERAKPPATDWVPPTDPRITSSRGWSRSS